ncbi:MAG TPA: ROK family protein [Thermomicrobiales bacterium]|nr:ROK family protein [Thermomicrobiales bacterium]
MNHQHVIAVDLGGTHIRTAVVDRQGRLTHRHVVSTGAGDGHEAVIERMADLIARTAADAGVRDSVPVGVASPGPLNPRTGTVLYTPNLPGWRDVPLIDMLVDRIRRPVHLANDGNCAALGEMRYGSAQGIDDLVYLALGTGVGGGVVCGGVLIDGARGLGAEVGHVSVAMDGPRCTCGSIGCLEAFVGGWAIQREAQAVATTTEGDLLRRLAGEGEPHAGVVKAAAEQGDAAALLILARAGRALGAAMGAFINLFNPRKIVIGGGVATLGELLMEPARRAMQDHSFVDMRADVRVTYSSLGTDTGLYGAAALALTADS